jgi:hypothetical protein
MTKAQRDELIRLITSPPAGSKIAAAKDFGVDLTLLVGMLELTPTERLLKLAAAQALVHELQAAKKAGGGKQKAGSAEVGPRSEFELILKILWYAGVRFVMVGDLALAAYGRFPATLLLELCYDLDGDNVKRLAKTLEPFHPRLRGVPANLPFCFDAATVASGMNFTLTTDIGEIDVFGEVTGIGGYKEAKALSITLVLFGLECAVLSLDGLIQAKRAAARPKDLLVLPEMEALREMETRAKRQSGPAEALNKSRVEDKQSET